MKITTSSGLRGEERSYRSLETKWSVIKHDVAKFAGHHAQCKDFSQGP